LLEAKPSVADPRLPAAENLLSTTSPLVETYSSRDDNYQKKQRIVINAIDFIQDMVNIKGRQAGGMKLGPGSYSGLSGESLCTTMQFFLHWEVQLA
jgi:hypothetical protein